MEAISQAGSAIGILAADGVVLAAEKRITSELLDIRTSTEKTYQVDDHLACAVAGITADANILINFARLEAQKYKVVYGSPIPVEQLLQRLCDLKQSYTQFGGLRPFGVSFLFAGWDQHNKFQLYQSDPSGTSVLLYPSDANHCIGNFGGWKATAIGANKQAAEAILKTDYLADEGDYSSKPISEALLLALKVLHKTMDTANPTPDKMEITTVTLGEGGQVLYHVLSEDEVNEALGRAKAAGLIQEEDQA